MPRRVWFSRSALFVTALLLAGCDPRDKTNDPVPSSASLQGALGRDEEFLAANDQPTFFAPKPKPDSLGILVASPVVISPGKNTDDKNFAAGIGWYLMNAVGGAPEFGQSPLYTTVFQATRRRRIFSLRMSPIDAARVARVSGATHIATAEIKETPGAITLQYQVASVPIDDTNRPVPQKEVVISAKSRAEMIAKLPALAQSLRVALGVKHSVVTAPSLQSVSPELMARMGDCVDAPTLTQEQLDFLASTGKRFPLALPMATYQMAAAQAAPYTNLLWKTMPRNTQAVGMMCEAQPWGFTQSAGGVYALSDRYEENAILAYAAALAARSRSDWKRNALYSKRSVQNAPANTDTHLEDGWSIGESVNRLRHEWKSGEPNPAQLAKIKPIYDEWIAQNKVATQCDPLYGTAYQRLAAAALFAGDLNEADAAMTIARKLNKRFPYETYILALDMYQPKWIDNPKRLREVAEEAASTRYYRGNELSTIYRKLGELGFTDLQKTMTDRQKAE